MVVIVEQNRTGHRSYYVRLLAEAAIARGEQVVVVTSADESMGIRADDLPEQVRIEHAEFFDPAHIARMSRRAAAQHVVVPDGDRFAIALARAGKWQSTASITVLVMRETAQPAPLPFVQLLKTALRRRFFRRAARISGVRIGVLKSAGWAGRSDFVPVVDPVTLIASREDAQHLRDQLELSSDRYWFAVLGAVSARKNIGLIGEALERGLGTPVGLQIGRAHV